MKLIRLQLGMVVLGALLSGYACPSMAQDIGTGKSQGTTANATAAFKNYECDLSGNASPDQSLSGCTVSAGGGSPGTTSNAVMRYDTVSPLPACGTGGAFCGTRTDANSQAQTPINAWGSCEWVDNFTSNSLFVPFGVANDWNDFITNVRVNNDNQVVLTKCVMPQNYMGASGGASATQVSIAPPYTGCASVMTNTPTVYGRPGSMWPYPASTPTNTAYLSPSFVCDGATASAGTQITSSLQWVADMSDIYWTLDAQYSPNLTLIASGNVAGTTVSGTNITVLNGTPVTLTWGPAGSTATSVSNSANWGTTVTKPTGTWVVTPAASPTYYTLTTAKTVTNPDGSTTPLKSTASATVNLVQNIGVNLTGSGTSATGPVSGSDITIQSGTAVTLAWTVTPPTGIAVTCTASSDDGSWTGFILNSGSQSVTPNVSSGNVVYTLSCSDIYESNVTSVVTVTIADTQPAQCGTATVDMSGNVTSGQLCTVGTASTVMVSDGSYTCTSGSGASASVKSCTATVGTSGNVDVEISDRIWRSKTPAEYLDSEGLVPSSSCTVGENYKITSVTVNGLDSSQWDVQINLPGTNKYTDQIGTTWQALANHILGMTLQCQDWSILVGRGSGSGYQTYFGLGFANGVNIVNQDMPISSLPVMQSNGSPGTISPNNLYYATAWSGP